MNAANSVAERESPQGPEVARPPESETASLVAAVLSVAGYGRMLEIGYRSGAIARSLKQVGLDVTNLVVASDLTRSIKPATPETPIFGSMTKMPFADGAFCTVVAIDCLQDIAETEVSAVLREIYRVSSDTLIIRLSISDSPANSGDLPLRSKRWWENELFEAGFRKHPDYYRLNDYESAVPERELAVLPYQRISPDLMDRYPLRALSADRDLHMDMLREHGSRSDAHVARYQLACRFVRPGDAVLDAATGMGYGSHVLSAQTKCSSILGVDSSITAIAYAERNFGRNGSVRFEVGSLPTHLEHLPSGSIDCIVSFETLEHVEDPPRLLSEFHRLLSPGGRLIASVPNDWSDETGRDPNPHHLHIYDRAKLISQLGAHFELEHQFAQTADRIKLPGRQCAWAPRPRSLKNLDSASGDVPVEAEWLLAVACKSPIGGDAVPYVERAFSNEQVTVAGNTLAFARDYRNPWLVRAMVSIGLRTESRQLRRKWALDTSRNAPVDSADHGAALCIMAYLDLEDARGPQNADLVPVDRYLSIPETSNPTILRWQVSLAFVTALRFMALGRHEDAGVYLKRVLSFPASSYSLTLLTKPAEAAYWLGILELAKGNAESARQTWRLHFSALLREMAARLAIPYSGLPPNFELREIALAFSFIGRLSSAAWSAGHVKERPAVFFDEISSDFPARLKWLETQLAGWIKASAARDASILALQEQLRAAVAGGAWHASQRDAWERVAGEREQTIAGLQDQLRNVRESNDWLASQRDAWERVARNHEIAAINCESSVAMQRTGTRAVFSSNEWHLQQRDAWVKVAADKDDSIKRLLTQIDTLSAGAAWHAAQWEAWARIAGDRELSIAALQRQLQSATDGLAWLVAQRDLWAQIAYRNKDIAAATERHFAALQDHLKDVRAGVEWHAAQRTSWQKLVAERERSISELLVQVQAAAAANAWHASQRDAWLDVAAERSNIIDRLKEEMQNQHADNSWLAAQRDAWAGVATKQQTAIDSLQVKLKQLANANAWHASQRDAWLDVAAERSSIIDRLQEAMRDQHSGNSWLATQRDAWAEVVTKQQAAINSLQVKLKELANANDWHASQRDVWSRIAEQQEQLLSKLTEMHQQAIKALEARETSLKRIRSHWGMRILNLLSFRRIFRDREQQ